MGQGSTKHQMPRSAAYSLNGKWADKDSELTKLISQLDKSSEKGSVHNQLGLLYYNREDFVRAEVHLSEAFVAGNTTNQTSYYLGLMKEKKKSYVDAVTIFKDAITKNANHADSYLKLTEIYLLLRNPNEALQYATECNMIKSNDSEVQTLIGLCHFLKRNYEKSEEFLNSALILDSQNSRALNIFGNLMRKVGKIDRAVDCYKLCLKYAPEFYPALLNLGLSNFEKGDIYNGILNIKASLKGGVEIQHSVLRKGFQIFFYDEDVLHGISLLYENQFEVAAVYFEQAFKKNPGNLVVNYYIGIIKGRARDYNAASYFFTSVINQINQQGGDRQIRNQCLRVILSKAREALKEIYENVDDTVNYSDCYHENEPHKIDELNDIGESNARKTQPGEVEIQAMNSQNYIINSQELGRRVMTSDNGYTTTTNDLPEAKRAKDTVNHHSYY